MHLTELHDYFGAGGSAACGQIACVECAVGCFVGAACCWGCDACSAGCSSAYLNGHGVSAYTSSDGCTFFFLQGAYSAADGNGEGGWASGEGHGIAVGVINDAGGDCEACWNDAHFVEISRRDAGVCVLGAIHGFDFRGEAGRVLNGCLRFLRAFSLALVVEDGCDGRAHDGQGDHDFDEGEAFGSAFYWALGRASGCAQGWGRLSGAGREGVSGFFEHGFLSECEK